MSDERISLVFAGGEFAFREANGHVSMEQCSPEELMSATPEAFRDVVDIMDWSHQPSSHYSLRMAADLVQLLAKKVTDGAHAVVCCCGADAVEEMAYLADLLWTYPQPLIFAVAHQSLFEPGGDASLVIREALTAASANETWGQGVLVCAGGNLYAASDVREICSFGRDRFSGVYGNCDGIVLDGKVSFRSRQRKIHLFDSALSPKVRLANDVGILHSTLGFGESFLKMLVSARPCPIDGLVVAGFGGGNVHPSWLQYLKALLREDIPVVVTSRCRLGCVREEAVSFEGSFQKLRECGVLSGGFLSPNHARIRLAVGIGAGFSGEKLQDYLLAL